MKHWCLGFIFNKNLDHVQLLRKGRTMHVGKWNGVGGSIEPNESPVDAMTRETREESHWYIDKDFWVPVGQLIFPVLPGEVHVFAAWISIITPTVHVDNIAILNEWEDDSPVGVPIDYISVLPLAPYVADLVGASLGRLKDPSTSLINIIDGMQ